ncbi:MAG: hypothetical protein IIA87_04150 [Nanoarchaeota archaeon]|nr:hypothetical protein [Nanoarchaeota archaeon]
MKAKKRNKNKTSAISIVGYFLPGILLIALSLGAMFSIDLVRYSYFILIAVFLVALYYFNSSLTAHYKNAKMKTREVYAGFIGIFLLAGFFGMQSPQIPFKIYILGIGIVLIIVSYFKR